MTKLHRGQLARWLKPAVFLMVLGCSGTTIETANPPPPQTLIYFFAPPNTEVAMRLYPGDSQPAERQPNYDQVGRDPNADPGDVAYGRWYQLTVGADYTVDFRNATGLYFGSYSFIFNEQKLIRIDRGSRVD